jgi:hypothetical protein
MTTLRSIVLVGIAARFDPESSPDPDVTSILADRVARQNEAISAQDAL